MDKNAKAILDSGKFDFKSSDSKILQSLQTKYSKEYLPFIKGIVDRSDGGDTKLTDLLSLIQEIVQNLGKLLSGRLTGGTGHKLLKKVFDDLKKVESGFAYVKTFIGGEESISQALKESEDKTGISFDDLTSKHKEVRKHVETIAPKKTGAFKGVGGALAQGFAPLGGAAMNLATSALGPFAGLAMAGAKGVGGVAKAIGGIGSGMRGREEAKISEALLGQGKIPGATVGAGAASFGSGLGVPGEAPSSVPTGGEMRGQTLAKAASPIFYFFDRLAHKASWTAQVLDVLKKTPKEDKGGFKWPLFLGKIPGHLLKLIALLGGVGGLVGGVFMLNKVVTNVVKHLKMKFPDIGGRVGAGIKMMGSIMPGGLDSKEQLNILKGDMSFFKEQRKEFGHFNDMYFKLLKQQKEFVAKINVATFGALKKTGIEAGKVAEDVGLKGKAFVTAGIKEVIKSKDKEMVKEIVKIKEKDSKSIQIQDKNDSKAIGYAKESLVELKKLNKGQDKQTSELKPKKSSFMPPDTTDTAYSNRNTALDGMNAGRMRP